MMMMMMTRVSRAIRNQLQSKCTMMTTTRESKTSRNQLQRRLTLTIMVMMNKASEITQPLMVMTNIMH